MPLALSRERAEEAHTLRVHGYSWREIAGALGFKSVGAAQQAVASHRKRNPPPSREDTLADILERRRVTLQRLLRQLAVAETDGDSAAVAALSKTITAADAETSKIFGLYASEKVDVTIGRSPVEAIATARDAALAALEARRATTPAVSSVEPEPIDAEVVE
ncbi:hypothetical protein [Tsukamurella pulmonis]|nr:hypothetical protein [Tsukamurella pulmonis]